MKYSAENYARAFTDLIEKHPDQTEKLLTGLIKLIYQSGDQRHTDKIINEIEKITLKKNNQKKVVIYTARELSDEIFKKIKNIFGLKNIFEKKIEPNLIAGIKVVINGEQMLDNTLKKKLNFLYYSLVKQK